MPSSVVLPCVNTPRPPSQVAFETAAVKLPFNPISSPPQALRSGPALTVSSFTKTFNKTVSKHDGVVLVYFNR